MTTKTKRSQTSKTISNGSKPLQTDQNKSNPLYYEIPLTENESLRCMTNFLKTERRCEVSAVTLRVKGNKIVVGVLPENVK